MIDDMPYAIMQTRNLAAVAETQFAVGKVLQFTSITSCVAVVGRQWSGCSRNVVGVHLVASTGDANGQFDGDTADQAADVLAGCTSITVLGPYDVWENPYNGIDQAFARLTDRFSSVNYVQRGGISRLKVEINWAGQLRYKTDQAGAWWWL